MPTISLGTAGVHLHVWLMVMAAWVWLTDGLCCLSSVTKSMVGVVMVLSYAGLIISSQHSWSSLTQTLMTKRQGRAQTMATCPAKQSMHVQHEHMPSHMLSQHKNCHQIDSNLSAQTPREGSDASMFKSSQRHHLSSRCRMQLAWLNCKQRYQSSEVAVLNARPGRALKERQHPLTLQPAGAVALEA